MAVSLRCRYSAMVAGWPSSSSSLRFRKYSSSSKTPSSLFTDHRKQVMSSGSLCKQQHLVLLCLNMRWRVRIRDHHIKYNHLHKKAYYTVEWQRWSSEPERTQNPALRNTFTGAAGNYCFTSFIGLFNNRNFTDHWHGFSFCLHSPPQVKMKSKETSDITQSEGI